MRRLHAEKLVEHSLVPEPIIEVILSDIHIKMAVALGLWMLRRVEKFVRYTVDETLKKTADSVIAVLSAKIKRVVGAYSQRETEDRRPILVEIVIPGDRDVILLARVDSRAEFPGIDLENLVAEMEKYGDMLQRAGRGNFSTKGCWLDVSVSQDTQGRSVWLERMLRKDHEEIGKCRKHAFVMSGA